MLVQGREEKWEMKSLEMREKQVLVYSWRCGEAKDETLLMVIFQDWNLVFGSVKPCKTLGSYVV